MNLLRVRGYSAADVERMLAARKAWLAFLDGAASRASAVDVIRRAETEPWFDLAFLPKASKLPSDSEHSPARRELEYEPIAALRAAKAPLLFIYGGADPWVPVAQSVKELEALSRQQTNIQFAVLADANHEMMFQPRETMPFGAKATAENAPQAPAYFMLMASWLSRQLAPTSRP